MSIHLFVIKCIVIYLFMMNEKKPNRLLQKIFELRKAKGISLSQLGRVMGGVGKSAASHIENGDAPLKAEHIPSVAKLLGVQPWELFVDYKVGEIGPFSEDERELVLNFRAAKDEESRKAIRNIVKQLAKRSMSQG
jgi:transcriptional regulator with XRE-family HTH domain